MIYENPWYSSSNPESKQFFDYSRKSPRAAYRGVLVFKDFNEQYTFVIGKMAITQRAGITKYIEVIDGLLDGQEPNNHHICEYLKSLGFKAKSYSDFYANGHNQVR